MGSTLSTHSCAHPVHYVSAPKAKAGIGRCQVSDNHILHCTDDAASAPVIPQIKASHVPHIVV